MGLIGSIASRLRADDPKGLLAMFERMGENMLVDAVGGGPLGNYISAFFDYNNRTNRAYQSQEAREERQQQREELKAKIKGRKQHQIWLSQNSWRFDWRSQPRRPAGTAEGGEWMPGRLDYPVAAKPALSRSQRRLRTRALKEYKARRKALGESNTRTIRTAWGDF